MRIGKPVPPEIFMGLFSSAATERGVMPSDRRGDLDGRTSLGG